MVALGMFTKSQIWFQFHENISDLFVLASMGSEPKTAKISSLTFLTVIFTFLNLLFIMHLRKTDNMSVFKSPGASKMARLLLTTIADL